jgi:hypothetical protein
MPGIDYARLKTEVRIEQVLALAGFRETASDGNRPAAGQCIVARRTSTGSSSLIPPGENVGLQRVAIQTWLY